jgi:hypothetical protein
LNGPPRFTDTRFTDTTIHWHNDSLTHDSLTQRFTDTTIHWHNDSLTQRFTDTTIHWQYKKCRNTYLRRVYHNSSMHNSSITQFFHAQFFHSSILPQHNSSTAQFFHTFQLITELKMVFLYKFIKYTRDFDLIWPNLT